MAPAERREKKMLFFFSLLESERGLSKEFWERRLIAGQDSVGGGDGGMANRKLSHSATVLQTIRKEVKMRGV